MADRRRFLSVAGLGALAIAADARIVFTQAPVAPAALVPDLILTNGRIHAMDARNSIVESVAIRGGQFQAVGGRMPSRAAGTRVIDLRGRTVIPGIIDAHNHFVNLGNRPGYHTILENARSIRDVQRALADRRRDVPAGEFITAMGGWHTNMGRKSACRHREEIDEAVSDRPVFLLQTFNGPSVTSSAGKAFFEREPNAVVVADNGAIAGGMPSTTALFRLRQQQTLESKMRGTVDAWRYSAGLGLTATSIRLAWAYRGRSLPASRWPHSTRIECATPGRSCPDRAGRSSGCRPISRPIRTIRSCRCCANG